MLMDVVFGVKTDDIETARAWVEKATGLTAEGRESAALGGDYYLFEGSEDEKLKLISNVDFDFYEPIFTESDEWKVAISLEGTSRDSPVLRGLETGMDHFVKLEEDSYED